MSIVHKYLDTILKLFEKVRRKSCITTSYEFRKDDLPRWFPQTWSIIVTAICNMFSAKICTLCFCRVKTTTGPKYLFGKCSKNDSVFQANPIWNFLSNFGPFSATFVSICPFFLSALLFKCNHRYSSSSSCSVSNSVVCIHSFLYSAVHFTPSWFFARSQEQIELWRLFQKSPVLPLSFLPS